MTTPTIDLNADLGESPAALDAGTDAALLAHITSANIACTGHAGDDNTMRRVIQLALEHRVDIGAHPAYPDRANFGRTSLNLTPNQIKQTIEQQIAALMRHAEAFNTRLTHVKPHGSLYHDASTNPDIAHAILEAARACDPQLLLIAQANTPAFHHWQQAGAAVIAEAFADRRYAADASLINRNTPNALITDPAAAAAQAVEIALHHRVTTTAGTPIPLAAQTLCIHSDTPGAATIAASVHRALRNASVTITAPSPHEDHPQ